MPIQAFAFEIKALNEKGQFSGLASTYGNVDAGGDVCMAGCFTRTLAEAGKQRPLLWQHRDPVGVVMLADSPMGLMAEGQLSMAVSIAKDAYALLKDGVVRGLSIGFQTVKESFVGDVRQLVEVKLYEVSLVTFPMNEMAMVAGVKAAQQDRLRAALMEFKTDILRALDR